MLNKILTLVLICAIALTGYKYIQINETENILANQIYQLEILRSDVKQHIEYLDIIYQTAERYNLPPELALAIMKTESNFNVTAVNGTCHGLMQVNSLYHTANLLDLRENVECSFSLLSALMDESDSLEQALGKYNRGEWGYKQYVKSTGIYTTSYSKKVIRLMNELKNETS